MYCEFFGLLNKPFDVTPDPRFLFLSEAHREALASLIYGIRERRGFIVLTGEVGTGKTTLLNTVLDRLDQQTRVAYLFNTKVDFETLLNGVLVEFGIAKVDEFFRHGEAIHRLNRYAIGELRQGRNVVLIVDEAQNLDRECMESLRLLSNLETRRYKLLQIILSGQPELDQKLRDPRLRQLAQRISIRRTISPLSEEDTYAYIRHRLEVAGAGGRSLFDRGARQRIWEYSAGIPRGINVLCDNCLLIAFGTEKKKVGLGEVEEAIRDLSPVSAAPVARGGQPVRSARRPERQGLRPAVAVASGIALLGASLYFSGLYVHVGPDRLLEYWIQFKREAAAPPFFRGTITVPRSPENSGPGAGADVRGKAPAGLAPEGMGAPNPPEAREAVPAPAARESKDAAGSLDERTASAQRSPESIGEVPDRQVTLHRLRVRTGPSEADGVKAAPEAGRAARQPDAQGRTVQVKPGETLLGILTQAYGIHAETMLPSVLAQNPELGDPNLIEVGQIIRLPDVHLPRGGAAEDGSGSRQRE